MLPLERNLLRAQVKKLHSLLDKKQEACQQQDNEQIAFYYREVKETLDMMDKLIRRL